MMTLLILMEHHANDRERHRVKVRPDLYLLCLNSNAASASNQPTPLYRSADSDSDSEGYVGARRNVPSKKERQRRLLVAEGHLPPSHSEVRFSQRRVKQVKNYNEDGEDSFEEEEEDTTPNYWATAAEYSGPAIDKVLDHKPKPDLGLSPGYSGSCVAVADHTLELDPYSIQKKDFEYLVSVSGCSTCSQANSTSRSNGKIRPTTILPGRSMTPSPIVKDSESWTTISRVLS